MKKQYQCLHFSRIGRALLVGLVLSWSMPAAYASISVDNPIPSLTITCSTCDSLATLESAALAYFDEWDEKDAPGFPVSGLGEYGNGYFVVIGAGQAAPLGQTLPDGTIIMVISTQYAIAANFVFGYNKALRAWQATPLAATSDSATRGLDNILNGRASEIPPIQIPSTYSNTDTPELISAYVQTQIVALGPFETNIWHALGSDFGQYVEYEVSDLQTGKDYWIYVGDSITFQFSDGSSEKWEYYGPYPSAQWQPISGTLVNKNGNVIGQTTPSGGAVTGAGFSYVWAPDVPAFDLYPFLEDVEDNPPSGTITIDWGVTGIYFCTDSCD